MEKASLGVILLGLALALPMAAGQGTDEPPVNGSTNESGTTGANETAPEATPAGPVSIVLTGHGEGGAFFFALEGESKRNPTLTVAPGSEVTVTLKTVSGAVHNFCTDASGTKTCTKLVSEGDEASITFTVPDEPGSFEYWCDPHRSSKMIGRLVVGTAPSPGGGASSGSGEEFAGETVDLGDLGYPECAGTKVPRATADRTVGGPTINDYVERCHAGGETVTQTRAKHAADYVIPGSIVLIALGIVGVVWAHRAYKP